MKKEIKTENIMKIIKLTSSSMNKPVYININHIGDFYEYEGGTIVGVTTHNNGGFKVKESVEEVLKIIEAVID